ncbi:hypothetical protein [Cryobacterium sp. AP23]
MFSWHGSTGAHTSEAAATTVPDEPTSISLTVRNNGTTLDL